MKLHTQIKQVLADTKTPVSLYLGLRDKYLSPLLLESSDHNSREGHYSYICLDPLGTIKLENKTIRTKIGTEIHQEEFTGNVPLSKKITEFKKNFGVQDFNYPFCCAGLFGYMSYDIINYVEDIKLKAKKDLHLPELQYNFYSLILVFDHQTNSLFIVSHSQTEEENTERIRLIEEQIESGDKNNFPFRLVSGEKESVSEKTYLDLVTKAKAHCQQGDVFQLVLSRRFSQKFRGDEFNVYRALKNINPSPYLFYFDLGDFKLFGSSPEAQLVVKNNIAEIHPIAGTYKRSGDVAEDLQKAKELSADPKETAEHMMLVDLARNDLSKYCDEVKVQSLKQVQFFSHVIHLVSKVTGKQKPGLSSFDLLGGTFPAGTLSGAPKYKAISLIDSYEPRAREFYGGCVGFIGMDNDINHAIMIRTFLSKDNTLHYQAGAGIVVSSNEESELKEINNKISALRKALVNAANFTGGVSTKEITQQPSLTL